MKMNRRKTTSHPYFLRNQKHRADTEDRISDLPEPILGHILSNLPIQNAVATGILSKRWRFLWTTVGNLDFRLERGANVEQFVQSVNYVMLLHKPAGHFNKLCLTWKNRCIPSYVNTWICTAVARNVRELSFHVRKYKIPLHVQSYLLTNDKLKSLDLECKICISPEIVVSLPRLETLELNYASFQSEEAFRRLLDGCPVLKRLCIVLDDWNSVAFKCTISSTCLKHLELSTSAEFSPVFRVELDAPSLDHIYLLNISRVILHQRLNCLSRAIICPAFFGQEARDPDYCNSFVQALHALSCVKTVYFSSQVLRVLSHATIKLESRFNRLTGLEVERGKNCWSAIQNLIELSDNLKLLILDKDSDDKDNEEGQFNNSNWTKPNIVPRCLSNSLMGVSICDFDGRPDELTMIEYIIKHGSVLKFMDINLSRTCSSLNRKDELVQLISTFPKKSTICEVIIVDFVGDSADDA